MISLNDLCTKDLQLIAAGRKDGSIVRKLQLADKELSLIPQPNKPVPDTAPQTSALLLNSFNRSAVGRSRSTNDPLAPSK